MSDCAAFLAVFALTGNLLTRQHWFDVVLDILVETIFCNKEKDDAGHGYLSMKKIKNGINHSEKCRHVVF